MAVAVGVAVGASVGVMVGLGEGLRVGMKGGRGVAVTHDVSAVGAGAEPKGST